MKIEFSCNNSSVKLIPENDLDIFNLGIWSHKIPMSCHYVACEDYRNELIGVSIEIKHFLVLLEKCRMNDKES